MIKPFIIAAVTADGFIAKDESHAAMWTSKDDKKRFVELTKRAGVVIMGSTTYKTLPRPLKDRVNVVYTRSAKSHEPIKATDIAGSLEYTDADPKTLLDDLESRGFKEAAICGGAQIYTSFLKAKLVDKIYLSIEPVIFGKGITLFKEELQFHLKLIDAKASESGSLLLEYKVEYHGNM